MRQYVGARYVPKFMGTYDATQAYEALCVVDNGLGTSYIAKVPTPAGTPLTDTTYWTIYGAAGGAIINLQNQIDNINNNTIPPIQSDIASLKLGKLSIDGYHNIILVGDSYGDPAVSGGRSWLEYTELHFASDTSRTFTSYYWGGAGFCYDSSSPYYYATLFDTMTADSTADLVVILCGANDGNQIYNGNRTVQNIGSGLDAGMIKLKEKFPNARVKLGFVGKYKDVARNYYYKLAAYAYKYYASVYDYDYIENSDYVLSRHTLIGDQDVHPTLNGSEEISHISICAVLDHIYNYEYHETVVASTELKYRVDSTNNYSKYVWEKYAGDNLIGLAVSGTFTPLVTTYTVTGMLPSGFQPNREATVQKDIPCLCRYSDTQAQHPCTAKIIANGTDLELMITSFEGSSVAAHPLDRIYLLSPFTMECATEDL